MRYLRLGEIPPNEKSINWFKVKLDDQSDFSWSLDNGLGYDSAIRCIRNYEDVLESGVSVFEIDENENPVFTCDNLKNTYNDKVASGASAYIVEGVEVGKGCDGEPLIQNIKVIKTL